MRIYEGYDCVNIPEVGFNGYIMFPKDEYQVKKHPVLYLFHGTGGVEEWFCSSKGNMPEFMNEWVESSPNNIPMIVVFPKVSNCTYATEYVQYQKHVENYVKAIRDKYSDRMLCDCKNTAVAGFSLGGAFALYCSVLNSDLFYHVGGFSSSRFLYNPNNLAESWLKNKEDLILPKYEDSIRFIGSGESVYGDFQADTERYYDTFKGNGTIFNGGAPFFLVSGGGHCFYTFNRLLREFLDQNIFIER